MQGNIDHTEAGKRRAYLRGLVLVLQDEIVELANELFEKQNLVASVKLLVMRDFGPLIREMEELSLRARFLREKAAFLRSHPDQGEKAVADAEARILASLEVEAARLRDEIEFSQSRKGPYTFEAMAPADYREAKRLWRALIRMLHPDLNPAAADDGAKTGEITDPKEIERLRMRYNNPAEIRRRLKEKCF